MVIVDGILTIHKRVYILELATAFILIPGNAVRCSKMLNQKLSHEASVRKVILTQLMG